MVYSWLRILNRDPRHIYKNVNWHTSALKNCHTKLREHDEVFSIALWAGDTCGAVPPLFLHQPQRWRHDWWTHLVEPRQRHGRTHSAVRSSSSVAKHTQQLLKNTHTQRQKHISTRLAVSFRAKYNNVKVKRKPCKVLGSRSYFYCSTLKSIKGQLAHKIEREATAE